MMTTKLHIETTGGPSPSVIVRGQREDLEVIADALKSGSLPAWGFPTSGSVDALAFRTVADITPLLTKEKKRTKWFLIAVTSFWAAVAGVLYLAYLGARSLVG